MKFYYCLLFSLSFLFISLDISAQCTGCDRTISTNSNFSIASGEKVCVTFNGTFTANIDFSGNGTLCVSSSTTISNSVNMNLNGNNNHFQNYGTWNKNLNLGTNSSSFSNFGTFSVGSLTVGNGNTFTSTTAVTVTGSTQLGNNATMSIAGNFSTGSYIGNNNSTLTVGGNYTSTGTTDVSGTINVTGNLSTGNYTGGNSSNVTVGGNLNAANITTGGNLAITGTTSAVNVTNNSGGNIVFGNGATIAGAVQNNGAMQFNGNASIGGSFTNNSSGNLVINNSSVSVGGAFSNNGSIQAQGSCGRLNIAGASTNNGSGQVGLNNTQLDICDASAPKTPPNRGWDSQGAGAGNFGNNLSYCTCVPTLLPITLISFTAKNNNNKVELNWKTILELDNDFFEIERSFTGTDFIEISKINSQNKNNEKFYKERNYFYIDNLTDNNLSIDFSQNQTVYYKLKQVDTNGDFSYSSVVSVQIEKQINEEIKVIFLPNEWKFESKNPIQVKIYSSIGILKGIYDLNQNSISVANFLKGMYILHIYEEKINKITILKTVKQ